MTRTMLVALDGTSSAEDALPAAAALAVAVGARVLLAQPVPARSYDSGGAPRARRAAEVRTALQAHASRLHARYPYLNISVAAPTGPWAESVLDEASLEHAELIVADRRLAGATVLSRRSEVPLLLLGPSGEWQSPLQVLVPLDGSPTAEAILPVLVRLGANLALRATVLNVLPPLGEPSAPPLPGASVAVAALGQALSTRRHLSWATAAAYCRRVADWLTQHGVPAQVELRSGDAIEEIGRAALDLALDRGGLLALGLPEALPWRFGYSAERIVRNVPVPVLQLRSLRLEHVVPAAEPAPDVLAVPAEWDHRAYGGTLAGSRL